MRPGILLTLLIPVWLGACSTKQESAVKEAPKRSKVPPPPPPSDGIWDRVDSVASEETGLVYSGFQLFRATDFPKQKLPCCLRFRSFFLDISTIGMQAHQNMLVFHFSRFNDPMHFDKGQRKMVTLYIDDEWQDLVFFQVPAGKKHFRYVDKELLAAKLTDATSAYGAYLADVSDAAKIRKGVLEGWRLNDTTWQLKLDASYRESNKDSSWTVKVKVNKHFYMAKPDTSIWHYRCQDEE